MLLKLYGALYDIILFIYFYNLFRHFQVCVFKADGKCELLSGFSASSTKLSTNWKNLMYSNVVVVTFYFYVEIEVEVNTRVNGDENVTHWLTCVDLTVENSWLISIFTQIL